MAWNRIKSGQSILPRTSRNVEDDKYPTQEINAYMRGRVLPGNSNSREPQRWGLYRRRAWVIDARHRFKVLMRATDTSSHCLLLRYLCHTADEILPSRHLYSERGRSETIAKLGSRALQPANEGGSSLMLSQKKLNKPQILRTFSCVELPLFTFYQPRSHQKNSPWIKHSVMKQSYRVGRSIRINCKLCLPHRRRIPLDIHPLYF